MSLSLGQLQQRTSSVCCSTVKPYRQYTFSNIVHLLLTRHKHLQLIVWLLQYTSDAQHHNVYQMVFVYHGQITLEMWLLQQHTSAFCSPLAIGCCNNAGSSGSTAMSDLALPADQGGHQPHLAAALAAQQQHCNQQKQLHAALQTDLTAIGKHCMLHI